MLSRRAFLATSAVSLGFAGLQRAAGAGAGITAGPLAPGRGPLALPPGFEQCVFSREGEAMHDGLVVPALHDGMGCFAGPDGRVILVRNHEIIRSFGMHRSAFGAKLERLGAIDRSKLYDRGRDGVPSPGGTTTVVFDPRRRELIRHHLSLGGTGYNCAGGATPWGTWITCEEWTQPPDAEHAESHGWCFEVPAESQGSLVPPRRLPGLGRFKHEAVAVAPAGDAVYLTEDIEDGCLYRFLPATRRDFAGPGRLQALAAIDRPALDTRNWPVRITEGPRAGSIDPPVVTVRPRERFAVRWIDLDDVGAPKDDLRHRARALGAMRLARCEGIWYAPGDGVYIAATTGGAREIGQIWRYALSPHEGHAEESAQPPTLELFVESSDPGVLKHADNLTVAPWGELFVCEDGAGRDGIVRVGRDGAMHRFAINMTSDAELAGPCFSPDGRWLFVNVQSPGMTIGVTGPWESLREGSSAQR